MPSYAIIIKHRYTEFNDVWNECKKLLYINSRVYMEKQQKPINLRLGIVLTIFELKP
jgi:hypothetical protein